MDFKLGNTHSHSSKIHKTNSEETEKRLKTARSDCLTGDDKINRTCCITYRNTTYIYYKLIHPERKMSRHVENCKDKSNTKIPNTRTTILP